MKKITVTFDLNEPQWEDIKRQSKYESGWHMCDLIIRFNGKDLKFEADYMRDFFQAVKKEMENE